MGTHSLLSIQNQKFSFQSGVAEGCLRVFEEEHRLFKNGCSFRAGYRIEISAQMLYLRLTSYSMKTCEFAVWEIFLSRWAQQTASDMKVTRRYK